MLACKMRCSHDLPRCCGVFSCHSCSGKSVALRQGCDVFLKRLERRKNGKKHTYWALVKSIRTAKGSRHRVVAYLGSAVLV